MHRLKSYPAVDHCIYCRAPGWLCKLGDEHIVAQSLGGNHVLEEASCSDCEAKTSYLDGYCANEIFLPIRVHHGVPRKRRKGNKRTHLPVLESFSPEPKLAATTSVRVEDHPDMLVLPVFSPPGIILGRRPDEEVPLQGLFMKAVTQDIEDRTSRLLSSGLEGVKMYREVKTLVLARMLAKVAHSYAVATLGINGFHAMLPGLIVRGEGNPGYLVGCVSNPVREPRADSHLVELEVINVGGRKLVAVWIWLYAYFGAPIYAVVAGESNTAGLH